MRFAKPFIALATTIVLAFALAGCSTGSSSGVETRAVTDVYGRSVTIPANVETCATVGSAARFVVYAGGADKLIAVTEMDKPASAARPYTIAAEQLLAKLPTTSNGNHLMETSVDGEALLELKPDVIISSRSAQECDELQNQIKIPVIGISYQDQIFTKDVFESIQVVGDVLDTSEHAMEVIDKMNGWQADLDSRTATITDDDKPSCYAGAVNYKGAKSFEGTYAQYPPFEAVHIDNVADSAASSGSVEVTLEQLGEWNPDFMFLNASNMELMRKDYADNQAFFNGLKAFQTGNLYTQPSYNMNGTNIEIAICDAYFNGATVYPEAFADVDLENTYREILQVMLGVDCYDQLKAKGLVFDKLSF
ncbi:MAG: ABC transporter substrate-binding protein [Coriobacteriales bacterium]